MRIGEVCLLTEDVVRLADFYKRLLEIDNDSSDPVHQTIIAEETMLTVLYDEKNGTRTGQNICLAFTVDDLDKEYQRVLALGAEIVEEPAVRPWGAANMSFRDPDGNTVYFRSFPKRQRSAEMEAVC